MRKILSALLMSILLPAVVAGQALVVVPTSKLTRQKQAMQEAYSAWVKGDHNLEKNLFSDSRRESLRHIDLGATHAHSYFLLREEYLATLTGKIRKVISAFDTPSGRMNPAALKEALGEELSDVGSAEKELQIQQANPSLPAEGPKQMLVQAENQQVIGKLEKLRQNLRRQSSLLDRAGRQDALLARSRTPMLSLDKSVLQALATEVERTKRESRLWKAYYQSLRELVSARSQPHATSGANPPQR